MRWIVAVTVLTLGCVAWASRPEPNAFLNRKADTVQQLVQQVKTDGEVADRFERHFGKSKEELVAYFSDLHLARLNEDGTYMIYSVDDKGIIKARPQHLKAGTRVFADASGLPVLKASCGNAMTSGSNVLTTTVSPAISTATDTLREFAVTTPESVAVTNQTAVVTPASPIALMPATPGAVTTGGSNQGFALPAALAALGGAAGLLLGSGGSAPVPEPATLVVMAGAVLAFKLRRKNK